MHVPGDNCKSGFTLLEMSIVLVVVALIVGGIVGGESLMRAARFHRIESTMSEFRSGYLTFRDKYGYPPGDVPNATTIWGAANATPSTCLTVVGTSGVSGTCNGDGDGLIDRVSSGNYWQISPEAYLAWQQLSLAGLTGQSFSGRNGAMVIGDNVPNMELGGVTAVFKQEGLYKMDGNGLRITNTDNSTQNWDNASVLSIQDAQMIDTKLDDGHANSGAIYATGIGNNGGDAQCTGSDASSTGADYLSYPSNLQAFCTLTWWMY